MGINCSSLSVGDWFQARMVKWDYEDLDITPPMRVAEISSDEVMLQLGSVKHYAFVDDLQPIPITAEVLEKNGWWKIPYSDKIYTIEGDNYSLVYYIEGNVADFRRESDRCSITCNYIHELQRALRLVKVEKEITL